MVTIAVTITNSPRHGRDRQQNQAGRHFGERVHYINQHRHIFTIATTSNATTAHQSAHHRFPWAFPLVR